MGECCLLCYEMFSEERAYILRGFVSSLLSSAKIVLDTESVMVVSTSVVVIVIMESTAAVVVAAVEVWWTNDISVCIIKRRSS